MFAFFIQNLVECSSNIKANKQKVCFYVFFNPLLRNYCWHSYGPFSQIRAHVNPWCPARAPITACVSLFHEGIYVVSMCT